MLHCALAQFEGVDTEKTVGRVIDGCRSRLDGMAPAAGLVFAGGMFDHGRVLSEIAAAFPGIRLIGCTTAGEFSSAFGFSEDSIILCILSSRTVRIGMGLGRALSRNPEAAVLEAVRAAHASLGSAPVLGLIFPSALDAPMGRVLNLLCRHLGPDCPVFGAGAGADETHMAPLRQFFDTDIVYDALPLLLFSGPLRHAFSMAQSWTPVGPEAIVTRSRGRQILRIDRLAALDFYQHYLGPHEEAAVEFPLAVREPGITGFYLRGPIHYDLKERSVTFTDAVLEGARVQLTEAMRDTLLTDVREAAAAIRREAAGMYPSLALAFSCSLRKEVLGSRSGRELDILREAVPPRVPILGFYGYGEIGPLIRQRESFFHNATLISLLIGTPVPDGRPPAIHSEALATTENPDAPGPMAPDPQTEAQDPAFLERKLFRAEACRTRLEHIRDQNATLHRQIINEMDIARRELERKEKALRGSEEKYRRIVETAGQGFILMDENMVIRDVNDAYCRMLGYPRQEIIGHTCFNLAREDFREYMLTHLDRFRAMEQRKIEGTLVSRGGREIPILILGSNLRDDQGRFLGNMAFVTDLSEQKKALALAGEVQKSLLPSGRPCVRGLDVAGAHIPCEEIGGDYFDYLYAAPDGPFRVVVGDIAGHGVDAALLMTSARAFLRMRASQPGTEAEIVASMNRYLAPDVIQSGRFMTLFFMTLHADRRSLRWVRAGHDAAMLYDPAADRFEELLGKGVALGIASDPVYEENDFARLFPNQIIAIGTDGLWETRNDAGEMFGKDRIRRIIRDHADADADTVLKAVFEARTAFSRGTRPRDDVTLVLIKILD